MRKKKNAFTLIELLAVIVILAVILVISIPRILDVIETSKKDSFKSTAQLIADSAEKKYVTNKLNNIDEEITCESVSKLNKEDYEYCFVKINEEGKATVTIEGNGKFKDLAICNGTKEVSEISEDSFCPTDSSFFTYKEVEGGISITGYNTKGGKDVIIPSEIEGKRVVSIETQAFMSNQLTSVTIPNSVTSIGEGAFWYTQLTSVTIPSSVTSIETNAFRNNQLTSVTIPNSVTSIGISAFSHNQLTSATIPNSVTSIGFSAFNNNQLPDEDAFIYKRNSDGSIDNTTIVSYGGKNKSPIIPDSVTSIGMYAFDDTQLTSVTIPSSVTSIETNAFRNNQLTSVIIPNGVKSIKMNTFRNNQLTSVTIPDSVTSIGEDAFYGNQLTSVTIPNRVTYIGTDAFRKDNSSNPNLTKIINKTGKSFNWGTIVSQYRTGYNFVTGTVVNSKGNIEVVSE